MPILRLALGNEADLVCGFVILLLIFLSQASLGTTKYCSYFLKSMQCPKPDCMYLHELGDEAASFTKDEMQVMSLLSVCAISSPLWLFICI